MDIRNRRLVTVLSDIHDPNHDENKPVRDITGNLEVIIVDITVLGMNQQLAQNLDFVIPIEFTTGEIRHRRRVERDTRMLEEGGKEKRQLSPGYVMNEFTEKQFEELYDNMRPIVDLIVNSGNRHFIWRQDEFDSELFMRKDINKKAPGVDALTPDEAEYVRGLINGISRDKGEEVPVAAELLEFME